VFPLVLKKHPTTLLQLAGLDSHLLRIPEKVSKQVKVLGFVENVSDFLLDSGIFVAPMLSGSGVKIKVLEAMNHGMPCVLSPKAADGLGPHLPITTQESAAQFANAIIELIESQSKRQAIGQAVHAFIQHNFSEASIVRSLAEVLTKRGI
jgi:glycosyltransferase involved in cell wall biosynthesis